VVVATRRRAATSTAVLVQDARSSSSSSSSSSSQPAAVFVVDAGAELRAGPPVPLPFDPTAPAFRVVDRVCARSHAAYDDRDGAPALWLRRGRTLARVSAPSGVE
jgi:hypothetical protein